MKYIPAVALAVFLCAMILVGALYVYITPDVPQKQVQVEEAVPAPGNGMPESDRHAESPAPSPAQRDLLAG